MPERQNLDVDFVQRKPCDECAPAVDGADGCDEVRAVNVIRHTSSRSFVVLGFLRGCADDRYCACLVDNALGVYIVHRRRDSADQANNLRVFIFGDAERRRDADNDTNAKAAIIKYFFIDYLFNKFFRLTCACTIDVSA